MPADGAHKRNRVILFRLRRGTRRLVAGSVCLRVRVGGGWIEAGELIRSMRTFEHDRVVRLGGALCERCKGDKASAAERLEQLAA